MPGRDQHAVVLTFANPESWGALHKFEKVATFAVLGVMIYLGVTESLEWVPLALGGLVAAALLLVRWPFGALIALMSAAAMPRYRFSISSWNAKPEHLVAAACFAILLFRQFSNNRDRLRQQLQRYDVFLLGFLGFSFVSSYVASPDRAATLRWSLLLLLATLPFFLVKQMVRAQKDLDRAMAIWLAVGAAEALFGILCFVSHLLFGTNFGVSFFFYLGFIPGVHGSQWEPNIFGSFCACFAVMFLFYYLADVRPGRWYLAGFLLTTVGVLLSLARQGWLCLIMVGTLVVLHNQRKRKIRWKRLLPVMGGILIALLVGTDLMRDLPARLATLAIGQASDDPTVVHRLQFIAFAVNDIRAHPIMGLGSSSFQLLYEDKDDIGVAPAWVGNLLIRVIHDTGIIGLILFTGFFVDLGRRVWRVEGSVANDPAKIMIGALAAGTLVMLIAYQLTDASTLAFTWIHLGILAAAVRLAESTAIYGRA